MAERESGKTAVAIGCDHAAFEFKAQMMQWLEENGYTVVDCGASADGSVDDDYPDIAKNVCAKVQEGSCSCAVLICGTGIGMSITANKLKGIRAALCDTSYSAKYSRLHNDANVLCMGARTIGAGLGKSLLETFLDTQFEGGRHQRRVEKIKALEN